MCIFTQVICCDIPKTKTYVDSNLVIYFTYQGHLPQIHTAFGSSIEPLCRHVRRRALCFDSGLLVEPTLDHSAYAPWKTTIIHKSAKQHTVTAL